MIFVKTEQIDSNPYQARDGLDADYIGELAIDILARAASRPETLGLLQVPLARLVDANGNQVPSEIARPLLFVEFQAERTATLTENGYRLQIAFGHSRLAAFRHLASDENGHALDATGRARYEQFPVSYADFTDEEMATSAWAENAQRKDLTAIEEAHAIQRALSQFGWSRVELGELWGLAASTISNKLRLLGLPNEVQAHVAGGEISERQAMAITPIYELPEQLTNNLDGWDSPITLVKLAQEGRDSDYLRGRTDMAIDNLTHDLSETKFPTDDTVIGAEDLPLCDGCSSRIKHKRVFRCTDGECYQEKKAAYIQAQLTQASNDLGLPIKDKDINSFDTEVFQYDQDIAAKILKAHIAAGERNCEKLHIEYAGETWLRGYHLDEYGYPDMRVVCVYGDKGHCTCLSSAKAAQTKQANANDNELQAKRARQKRVRDELINPAVELLATAIQDNEPAVWLKILKNINHSHHSGGDEWSLDKIIKKIAFALLESHWKWNNDKYGLVHHDLSNQIKALGLTNPWDTATRLKQVQDQLGRIVAYITGDQWTDENPMPQAVVKGNISNLIRLTEELAAICNPDAGELDSKQMLQSLDISERISDYSAHLNKLCDVEENADAT